MPPGSGPGSGTIAPICHLTAYYIPPARWYAVCSQIANRYHHCFQRGHTDTEALLFKPRQCAATISTYNSSAFFATQPPTNTTKNCRPLQYISSVIVICDFHRRRQSNTAPLFSGDVSLPKRHVVALSFSPVRLAVVHSVRQTRCNGTGAAGDPVRPCACAHRHVAQLSPPP